MRGTERWVSVYEWTAHLDVAGVEHDANAGTESLGRDVVAELGANNTAVAVRASDAAPDDADLGASDLLLRAVDEGDTLCKTRAMV